MDEDRHVGAGIPAGPLLHFAKTKGRPLPGPAGVRHEASRDRAGATVLSAAWKEKGVWRWRRTGSSPRSDRRGSGAIRRVDLMDVRHRKTCCRTPHGARRHCSTRPSPNSTARLADDVPAAESPSTTQKAVFFLGVRPGGMDRSGAAAQRVATRREITWSKPARAESQRVRRPTETQRPSVRCGSYRFRPMAKGERP